MKIYSIAINIHDHNTYDGEFHYQAERYTRKKHNLNPLNPHDPIPSREFFNEFFLPKYKSKTKDEVFSFTCSNLGQEFVIDLLKDTLPNIDFLKFKPNNLWDHLYNEDFYYIDHHQSHATYAFLSSGYEESDILAIDGRGWKFNCIFIDKFGKIIDLSEKISIGGLWNRLSQDLGFGYLGAGKTMGLVGYGKFNKKVSTIIFEYLKNPNHKLPNGSLEILKHIPKEDIAFTLQKITNDLITTIISKLKTSKNICLAGGVAYNGYLNELLTKYYDNVHVPPAVGDEGQSIGTYMHANYVLNNIVHIPNVFSGKEYRVNTSILEGLNFKEISFHELTKEVANEIAQGKIIGWYQNKSESGNRALGNRSILADPRNPNIKNIINSTIKMREDFRPFAPSVLEEYYQEYFDTNQPSPYMSRIVPVTSDKIPGVTHVDGTARIQTVNRKFNEKFYDLITEFYNITGIPMLLNTSFNCKEPIVETPKDAVSTFINCGLDTLVINDFIIKK